MSFGRRTRDLCELLCRLLFRLLLGQPSRHIGLCYYVMLLNRLESPVCKNAGIMAELDLGGHMDVTSGRHEPSSSPVHVPTTDIPVEGTPMQVLVFKRD